MKSRQAGATQVVSAAQEHKFVADRPECNRRQFQNFDVRVLRSSHKS